MQIDFFHIEDPTNFIGCSSLLQPWNSLSQVAVSTDNSTVASVAVSKTSVGPTISTIVRLGISRPLAITVAETAIAIAAISKSVSTITAIAIVGIRVSGPLAITIAETTIAVAAISTITIAKPAIAVAGVGTTIAVVSISLR